MIATQSLWLQLYFLGGCYTIPTFKVTVEGLPDAGFKYVEDSNDFADYNYNNYTAMYVQYPSSRPHTMLFNDEPLGPGEEDFVAFRLNLPQVITIAKEAMEIDFYCKGSRAE
jgi:hypothetical protein